MTRWSKNRSQCALRTWFQPFIRASFFWLFLSSTTLAADILALRPNEQNFKVALNGFIEEMSGEMTHHEMLVDEDTTLDQLQIQIEMHQPKLLLLLEGKSVALYKAFQETQEFGTSFPPALVMMTSYAEKRIKGMKNTLCIKYEIQAVHSLCSVRSLMNQPLRKIGVLYSSNLRLFFLEQQRMVRAEGFELVGVMIDEKKRRLDKVIKRSLHQLVKEEDVDAIWILNDNIILRDTHLEWAWVPQLKKLKKPVVVGLERLVSQLKVGHFAVVPDHYEMGVQGARTALDLRDADWDISEFDPIRAPYSARKKINTKHLPEGLVLKDDVLSEEWFDFGNAQASHNGHLSGEECQD